MADTFEDLGIAPELAVGVEPLGWDAPSGLQEAAVPVIRRGNNIVLHASAGAGAVGAYALGLLDRLAGEEDGEAADGVRALVLLPDSDAASRTAEALAGLGRLAGLTVRATSSGWPARPVDVLVSTPAAAMRGVRDSSLKLDSVRALVVDGADRLEADDQWDAMETLTQSIPPAAQRIVVTGRLDERVDGYLERHVRRALTIPPRAGSGAAPSAQGAIRYSVVPEAEKPAAVLRLLNDLDSETVAVVCRTSERAEVLSEALVARGVRVAGEDVVAEGEEAGGRHVLVLPRVEADQRSTQADVVSYDVPFDADELEALHANGGGVVVTPAQLPHLRRIASRAGFTLEGAPVEAEAPLSKLEALRKRIRNSITEDDLAPELALVEPLLREFSAAEVAAAALRLAIFKAPEPAAEPTARPAAGPPASATAPAAPAPPPSTSWVRLFVSAGSRDGLGPGDLVGSITGETTLSGEEVGKIEVRESHSTVEVPSPAADAVIKALNGRTLRGRSLRVDYDRQDRAQRGGGQRSAAAGRGGPGRGSPGRGGAGRSGGGPRGRSGPGGRGPGARGPGNRRPGSRGPGARDTDRESNRESGSRED